MQCVRCLKDTASTVASAPDGSGAWELYYCAHCRYSWRNTEPGYITDVSKRDPWGQLGGRDDIESVRVVSESDYRTMKQRPQAEG